MSELAYLTAIDLAKKIRQREISSRETLDYFLLNFPSVKRKQALEVLRLAEKLVTSEKIIHENFAG